MIIKIQKTVCLTTLRKYKRGLTSRSKDALSFQMKPSDCSMLSETPPHSSKPNICSHKPRAPFRIFTLMVAVGINRTETTRCDFNTGKQRKIETYRGCFPNRIYKTWGQAYTADFQTPNRYQNNPRCPVLTFHPQVGRASL